MRIDPNTAIQAQDLVNKHPTPWHIANVGEDGDTAYAWVCDAKGESVIGSSEWLNADYKTLAAIIAVFNCLHPESK